MIYIWRNEKEPEKPLHFCYQVHHPEGGSTRFYVDRTGVLFFDVEDGDGEVILFKASVVELATAMAGPLERFKLDRAFLRMVPARDPEEVGRAATAFDACRSFRRWFSACDQLAERSAKQVSGDPDLPDLPDVDLDQLLQECQALVDRALKGERG